MLSMGLRLLSVECPRGATRPGRGRGRDRYLGGVYQGSDSPMTSSAVA